MLLPELNVEENRRKELKKINLKAGIHLADAHAIYCFQNAGCAIFRSYTKEKSVREEVETTYSIFKRHDFQRTNQLPRKSIVLKTIDGSSVAPLQPKWRP